MAKEGRPLFLKQANAPPCYPPTNGVSQNSQPLKMRERKRKRMNRDHSFMSQKKKKSSKGAQETNGLLKVPSLAGFQMTNNTGVRRKNRKWVKEDIKIITYRYVWNFCGKLLVNSIIDYFRIARKEEFKHTKTLVI